VFENVEVNGENENTEVIVKDKKIKMRKVGTTALGTQGLSTKGVQEALVVPTSPSNGEEEEDNIKEECLEKVTESDDVVDIEKLEKREQSGNVMAENGIVIEENGSRRKEGCPPSPEMARGMGWMGQVVREDEMGENGSRRKVKDKNGSMR
jgi:hypothetical protein